MTDEQLLRINNLLDGSDLTNEARDLLRQFFESIAAQPQFEKILDLLEKFPSLFDNFCHCFELKRKFLASGATEDQWNKFLEKEKTFFEEIDK